MRKKVSMKIKLTFQLVAIVTVIIGLVMFLIYI